MILGSVYKEKQCEAAVQSEGEWSWRSLVLACGSKNQLVNSLEVPGSPVSWNQ